MRIFANILLLALFMLPAAVHGPAAASMDGRQVRVLEQGDEWEVRFDPAEYAYRIEFMEGNMFVTVKAHFMDAKRDIVYSTTHTLVEDDRMSALRSFEAEQVAEGHKVSALLFMCDSGRARISFGPAAIFND